MLFLGTHDASPYHAGDTGAISSNKALALERAKAVKGAFEDCAGTRAISSWIRPPISLPGATSLKTVVLR